MTHWAYNRYVSALTRPVRYRSRTGLETATVGVANLATRWREAPLAPPLGELLSKAKLRGCGWVNEQRPT